MSEALDAVFEELDASRCNIFPGLFRLGVVAAGAFGSELNELSGRLSGLAKNTLTNHRAATDMRNGACASRSEGIAADSDARTALKLQELIGREAPR